MEMVVSMLVWRTNSCGLTEEQRGFVHRKIDDMDTYVILWA
jgi:hypothetical protein